MSPQQTQPQTSRSRLTLALWSIFFTAIVGFGWFKSVENNRDEFAARDWEPRYQQLFKNGATHYHRLSQHFDSLQGTPNSQHQLEAELNNGQPFPTNAAASEAKFEWDDPQGGGHFVLEFRDGTLVGTKGSYSTDTILRVCGPQPTRASRESTAELVRRPLPKIAVYTWLAATLCWFVLRNWRVLAAQISFAAALLAGMAWLVDPAYSVTSQGIFSNYNLFFAALMLLASAGLLGLSIARRPSTWRLRFGLIDLLVVTAIAVILLAMGPFGYVALLVGAATALVFVTVFYCFHMPALSPQ